MWLVKGDAYHSWGTLVQAGRLWVQFHLGSFVFFFLIEVILVTLSFTQPITGMKDRLTIRSGLARTVLVFSAVWGLRILWLARIFLILDLYARHRVFKHSLTAVHLSADLGASADVDFDGGVATGFVTTFYLVICDLLQLREFFLQ
jgi:hypothetical protein